MTEDSDGGDATDDSGHTDEEDPVGEEQPDEAADSRETDTPQEDESLPEETDEAESVSENSIALLAASSDDFTVTDGKLTAYNGPGGNITIPNGVTEIGANVFKDKQNLTGVTFPVGLTKIGNSAFENAFSYTDVNGNPQYVDLTIPDTVASIGAYAFRGCKHLQTVKFEDNGGGTLAFELHSNVSSAFEGCTSLTTVTLPDRLEKLSSAAFSGCSQLKKVTFGTGKSKLTAIDRYAFYNCSSLEGITLPDTVKTIGERAFQNAFSYTGGNGDPQYVDLTIPASVTRIGIYAFNGCKHLQIVTFAPDNGEGTLAFEINSNRSSAFEDCTSLTTVTLPDRLQELGAAAFSGCSQLKKVTFGTEKSKLTTIGIYAFDDCSSLESITLPGKVTEIGERAFYGDSSLQYAELNEGLQKIGNSAFENAFSYTNGNGVPQYVDLTIPDTVASIGAYAFRGCKHLQTVKFEDNGGGTLAFELHSNVSSAFEGCTSLTTVTLPDRLEKLSSAAFSGCSQLKKLTFGTEKSQLTTIDNYAFSDCSSLEGITLPSTVTTIGAGAFSGASGLQYAELNEGLRTIGNSAFQNAFSYTDDDGVPHYVDLTIPASVTSMGVNAFNGCKHLQTVTFAPGNGEGTLTFEVSFQDSGAFADCTSLTEVTLPDRLVELKPKTFPGCKQLRTVKFGTEASRLTTIGRSAFADCSSLEGITLPDTVTEIGASAFSGDSSLQYAELNEGLRTIGSSAFQNAFNCTEPDGSKVSVQLDIPSTVTNIGASAFNGCPNLETVTFADSGKGTLTFEVSFGDSDAFANCPSLKTVLLPERLQELTARVVSDCPLLEILYIPEGTKTIADSAIDGCPKLTIYGKAGSEAEKYANKKKIPFRTDDNLGLNVTGVSLNRSQITEAVEEGALEKKTIQLKAIVTPATAKNKAVTYQSSNEAVASVDAKGLVTLNGYGTATITVTTVDGGRTAQCIVTVLHQFTEEQKQEIRAAFLEKNQLKIVTNIDPAVKNVTINPVTGYKASWRNPSAPILSGTHTYDILVEQDGYEAAVIQEAVEITGITVCGITLTGTDRLQAGKTAKYEATILYEDTEDAVLDADSYEYTWNATPANVLTVDQTGLVTAQKGGSKGTVKAVLKLKKNGTALPQNNNTKDETWFEASAAVTTYADAVVDKIEFSVTDAQNQKVELVSNRLELEDLSSESLYQITAKSYSGTETLNNAALTWSSSNTKTAKVKANPDGTVGLTVLPQTGSAVITATAKRNGGYAASFKIIVKDSTPRLEESSVTISSYQQTEPSALIHLYPSDGYSIKADSLSLVNKKDKSASDFTIEPVKDSTTEYIIRPESGMPAAGSKQLLLQVQTSKNESAPHELPLTVNVSRTKPKVSVAQTAQDAIDLYEVSGTGTVSVSADAPIETITFTSSAKSGPDLKLTKSDITGTSAVLTFEKSGADESNYQKTATKGTLTIHFKGYTNDADYKKAITLKANKKPSAYTAVAGSSTLYPDTAANSTTVTFVPKGATDPLLCGDGWTLTNTAVTGIDIKITQGEEQGSDTPLSAAVTMNAKAKGGKLKFTITNKDWYAAAKADVSCSIKKGGKLSLAFSNSSMSVNTNYPDRTVYTALSIKNYDGPVKLNLIEVKGKNAASVSAAESLIFSLDDDGRLGVQFKDPAPAKKSYQYQVKVSADGTELTGTLKITVTDKDAAVSYKQSGSIDLMNRAGSQIVCKPQLKNYSDQIEDVSLSGVGSSRFTAELVDGNAVIRAREGASLNVKTTYKPVLNVVLKSGITLGSQIKITPKQTNPKFTASVTKLQMYESVSGEQYAKALSFAAVPGKNGTAVIKGVKLVNGQDTFIYVSDGPDAAAGHLYISEDASCKVNKSYKLQFAITFEDGAGNVPVYATVTVNYKK